MRIGKKIKDLRAKNNLTQKDLAERLNVTPQAVSRWELDIVEPGLDTMRDMANLFGISLDEFIKLSSEDSGEESKEKLAVEEEPDNENLMIVGICKNCHKKIRVGEGEQRASYGKNKTIEWICNDCAKKEVENKEKLRMKKHVQYRNLAFIFASIFSFVALLAVMIPVCMMGNEYIGIGIGAGIGTAVLVFAFLFCMIMRNNFVFDMFLEVATWGCVKFPGIIFSLDFDGIVFLIATKILFAILGFILVVLALCLATAVSMICSIFALPFSIVWSFKRPDKTDITIE